MKIWPFVFVFSALNLQSLSATAAQASNIEVSAKTIPLPSAVSAPLQGQISTGIRTKQQVLASTPQNQKQWKAAIAAANAQQLMGLDSRLKKLGVTVKESQIAGVSVIEITPKKIAAEFSNNLYIDVHGGAYVYFAGKAGIGEALLVASRLAIKVIAIDYRMPPATPYPAASDDVFKVYTWVLNDYKPQQIAMGGTSAGGGLVASSIQRFKLENVPLPAAIYLGTPWADLTKTGDTHFTNEGIDRVLVTYDGFLHQAAKLYADGLDLDDSRISPVYGDFSGFPPTYLVTGTRDLFLSDTVRVNRQLRNAGVETKLDVFEAVAHADYLIATDSRESVETYRELKLHLIKYLE